MRFLSPLLLLLCVAAPVAAQSYTGTLGSSGLRRDDGVPYNAHEASLKAGQRATIRLESDGFDTYLIVTAPSGARFENDDFGTLSTSQVDFVAPEAGTYAIWASSYDASGAGAYTLTVTPGAIATIELLEGRLDPSDATLPKGEYADTYERSISSNKPFDIELTCFGFDGFLAVQSPSGKWYRNDDAGEITRSRVSDLASESGTWRIIVTSSGPGEVGAYDLRILTY